MRTGLILDGHIIVGKFKWFTCEDCYGKRELERISISNSHFDIVKSKADRQLKFLYVELLDAQQNKYRMIDDFGFGNIESIGPTFCGHETTTIEKVKFSKEPPRSLSTN